MAWPSLGYEKMSRIVLGFGLVAWLCIGAAACNKGGESDDSTASREQWASGAGDPRAEAQEVFQTRCVTCHGDRGEGNGPASAGLNPPPRNYTDPQWQASVTDEYIEQIIVQGGAAVGRSAAMPNNPDLRDKPEVVAALREIVRGFGRD